MRKSKLIIFFLFVCFSVNSCKKEYLDKCIAPINTKDIHEGVIEISYSKKYLIENGIEKYDTTKVSYKNISSEAIDSIVFLTEYFKSEIFNFANLEGRHKLTYSDPVEVNHISQNKIVELTTYDKLHSERLRTRLIYVGNTTNNALSGVYKGNCEVLKNTNVDDTFDADSTELLNSNLVKGSVNYLGDLELWFIDNTEFHKLHIPLMSEDNHIGTLFNEDLNSEKSVSKSEELITGFSSVNDSLVFVIKVNDNAPEDVRYIKINLSKN